MTRRLEVQGLRAGYGGVEILHGVDLVVPAGLAVAVTGPSGAGKTTLLRALSGTAGWCRGSIVLDGRPIDAVGPHERARGGLVHLPERGEVFEALSVRENLELARVLGAVRPVDAAVELLPQLSPLLDRRGAALSGGERRLVALARVLLAEPRVLLVDELTVGLAPAAVARLLRPLAQLRERGGAIVIVEPHVPAVLALVDVVVVVVRGRVQQVLEPGEVRARGDVVGDATAG